MMENNISKRTVVLWTLIKLSVFMSCQQKNMLSNEDMQPVVSLVFNQWWDEVGHLTGTSSLHTRGSHLNPMKSLSEQL